MQSWHDRARTTDSYGEIILRSCSDATLQMDSGVCIRRRWKRDSTSTPETGYEISEQNVLCDDKTILPQKLISNLNQCLSCRRPSLNRSKFIMFLASIVTKIGFGVWKAWYVPPRSFSHSTVCKFPNVDYMPAYECNELAKDSAFA